MTDARLSMIAMLVGPVATATANFCAASVSGARIPVLTSYCCRLRDVAKPQFTWFTGVARPSTGSPTGRCDRPTASAVFKSP